jgi:Na+/H+ antiporter
MPTVLLWAVMLAGIVVLTPLAPRVRVPLPVLLTVFGLALPLLPSAPRLSIDPALILPAVLPPLLFAATQRSTAHEFRESARPILLLAVGLTVATAAVVAAVAHQAGLSWGPAWVLGAVVSPPDPVAATAVARRLSLPGRLVTVLEGEGMFNDATALVLYQLGVLAVVTGHVTAVDVGWGLLLAVAVGAGVGFAAGLLTRWALAALHDAAAETTVTVAVPFVAYLAADRLHGSGVLAVLVLGLYLRSYGHPALTSGGWLLGRAVWRYLDYLITCIVFVLIGFELTAVLEDSRVDVASLRLAGWVVASLVVVRFAWMFPAAALARARRRFQPAATPSGVRETTIVAWAGMRGVVTVATALALPLLTDQQRPFPDRAQIVFVALVCVLVTLVVQGLTLAPLVKALGVGGEAATARDVASLRRRAAAAALSAVEGTAADPEVPGAVRRAVLLQYRGYLAAQEALGEARGPAGEADYSVELDQLLRRASEAEREVVLRARRQGEVSPEVADEVLHDVETRAVRDLD